MKKLVYLMLVALLVCSMTAFADGSAVVDGLGREVSFESIPETCVSLTPANTEILCALGLSDRIVGVDNQSDVAADALQDKERVGDYYAPNVESVVALNPDVVFASTTLQRESIDKMEELGLTVVCNDPTSLSGVIPGIELIAQVMGTDAAGVVQPIEAAIAEVSAAAAEHDGLKVYFALSFGEYGDYTAGPGTFIDDMIKLCGGTNVAGDMPVSWPQYSIEQLVANDPDLIIVSDYMGDGSIEQQLCATPGYQELRAVKEGRVYGVDANITSRPGPRIGEATQLIQTAMDEAQLRMDNAA
ncbi:ABC transporter substrate-binding protein [Eubacteriales bacterium OttesenSCG-928-N13]|nr:ABC transporter substrate-binding protein [Eubacteriales bacterium OttesenSCG-928-N13]